MTVFERLHVPSLGGATGWLNSAPLGPAELHGRVVLVDFWTLMCVTGCVRSRTCVRDRRPAVRCDLGYQPPKDRPPLTLIVWPVTCEAASEARKTATAATSSADGGRPNGKRSTTLANKSR
jgi:hypothetical protein